MDQAVHAMVDREGKYLTFTLAGEEYGIGMVVDSVSEVLNISGTKIEDPPMFGTQLNTGYILGMAKIEGGVKILLDIDKVLTQDEIGLLEKPVNVLAN
jgi:purine-binding chemotaxis protein CheW